VPLDPEASVVPSSLRVVFMGSASFAVPSLAALADAGFVLPLVVTRADKPSGRGLELSQTPVKQLAVARGLPVFQPKTLRTPEVQAEIAAARPDLIVVAAYGRILPPEILDLPPLGPINVHGSLLPRWRGAAPVQWSVIRGDPETGITIMRMDPGLDTGPMLLRAATPIAPEDTAGTVYDRLAAMGPALLLQALAGVVDRTIEPVPQDDSLATLAPPLKKETGRIDWARPSREIADLVRGVEPWPGAYTYGAKNLRLRLFPFAQPVPDAPAAPSGTVLAIDAEGALVRTGDGAVRLRDVQPAGSRRMTAREAAAGRRWSVGDVLGDGPESAPREAS